MVSQRAGNRKADRDGRGGRLPTGWAPYHQPHAGCPLQGDLGEGVATFQIRDQRGYLVGVSGRPIGLRQEVVDDIQAARSYEREDLIQVRDLPGPRVRKDKVELAGRPTEVLGAVHHGERHPAVVTQIAFRHLHHLRVDVDRLEPGRIVHPGKQPGGSEPRTRPELKKPAPWFTSGEGGQQSAGPRL